MIPINCINIRPRHTTSAHLNNPSPSREKPSYLSIPQGRRIHTRYNVSAKPWPPSPSIPSSPPSQADTWSAASANSAAAPAAAVVAPAAAVLGQVQKMRSRGTHLPSSPSAQIESVEQSGRAMQHCLAQAPDGGSRTGSCYQRGDFYGAASLKWRRAERV